jgi:hypothetical protein
MLGIKPLIKPYILNYYISSVIFVCRLEPFIAPFHYNCTLCLIYIYQGDLVLGSSYLILYIEYIVKGGFPLKVDCYSLFFYHSQGSKE